MKQTIKVADKPTADEIKQTVESNAEKLDGIVQELESGGMLSDPNLGLAALKQSLDELKNYVGNGKRDVASAITGKGIPTATDAGFVALVQNIDKIVTLMQGTQDANAGAGQILNGYTAYVKGSKVSGTIPSQGAQTITPGTSAKYVEAGRYLSGRQTIAGDANFVAAHLFWLQINLIDCHRINRYNDISIEKEKEKVPEHLFFCRDKCSGTIYKHGYYIKIRNRIQ